jgi:hypothetical protein
MILAGAILDVVGASRHLPVRGLNRVRLRDKRNSCGVNT